jgi:hypothetical protein
MQMAMAIHPSTRTPRRLRQLASGLLLAGLLAVLAPASSPAAITTFGSALSVPATLNTTENLGYAGTYTRVPPAPDAPNGLFHTFHYGADTAIWNVASAGGDPAVPATGQALKVSLEGCAQAASGGPRPLTQIHFQDISPLAGGGAKVNLSSQAFDIPVCGENGASGSTVTTYEPINLCVSRGDYVAFNDDGGYVENIYRSGVPYRVLGSVGGSKADSFLRNNGTGDGAILSSSDLSANDGFASNRNAELMLRTTLGTGPDATHICPGGTDGQHPPPASRTAPSTPVTIIRQTDGVNHQRFVAVAIYCRLSDQCRGLATLTPVGKQASTASYGRTSFSLRGKRTTHVRIRVSPQMMNLLRKHRGGVHATLSAVVGGKTVTQTIAVKIF